MKLNALFLIIALITSSSFAMNWWEEPKEERIKARQERARKELDEIKIEKEQGGFDDYNLLLNAAINNNIDRIEILLKQGTNPNKKYISGDYHYKKEDTPLTVSTIQSAFKGDDRILHMLINSGADINAEGRNGRTALQFLIDQVEYHYYYYPHIVHTITFLLNAGADPNREDDEGHYPLLSALVKSRKFKLIPLLLSHGADPNYFSLSKYNNTSPLMVAIKRLPYPDYDNAPNYLEEHLKIIHMLLQAGADPFLKTPRAYFSTDILDSAFTLAQKELESEKYPERKAAFQTIIDLFNNPQNIKKTGFEKIT